MKILLITLIMTIIITGCGEQIGNELVCKDINDLSTCTAADQSIDEISKIRKASLVSLTALRDRKVSSIYQIMSKDGIRFSPYPYVNLKEDVVVKKDDIKTFIKEDKMINRGNADGSGYPITTTFSDYRTRYIYNAKFLTEGTPYINTKVQRGNMKSNVYEVYSGDTIIEYYIPGKSQLYNNMDRKSLTLVFGKEDDGLKLKAIIHSERTM